MHDFFKPWRRKIGVVALGLACVFMGWGYRSSTIIDGVSFQSGTNSMELLASSDSALIWATQHGEYVGPAFQFICREITDDDGRLFESPHFTWHWRLCGFGNATIPAGTKQLGTQIVTVPPGTITVFPHWSIVLPLTLLSGWLLLSKTRPTKIPGSSPPTEPDNA